MKRYASLMIIASGCLWGTMGLFVRRLNAMGLESMQIVELRCITAALLLLPVLALRDRSALRLKPRQLPALLGSAVLSILFFNFCYFSAITEMDLSMAAILLYTAPIFVMLLSVPLFGEKLTGRKLLALVLAFGGCCLVCGLAQGGLRVSSRGLLLGLGSGIGYALYSIFSRYSLNAGVKTLSITFYTFLFAALFGLALTDLSVLQAAFAAHGLRLAGFAVLYTLVTTIAPYLLYTAGLQHVENGAASVFASVEPVMATVLGLLVFSEMPSLSAFAGMLLVLLALVLLNLSPKSKA